MQKLSIRSKLILVSILPILAFFFYVQLHINQEINKKNSAKEAISDVAIVQEISSLVHEIQKERALSLIFLASNGVEGREKLEDQRILTSKALVPIEKMKKEKGGEFSGKLQSDSLTYIRSKIDQFRPSSEVDPFFSDLKSSLLDQVSVIIRSSQNPVLKNFLEDHLTVLFVKEFMAQIRSELARNLAAKKFTDNSYGLFAAVRGKYEITLHKFIQNASPELKAFFLKKFQGPFIEQTSAISDAAFKDPSLGNYPYDLNNWLSVATSSINTLKEVEDYSGNLIREKADDEFAMAQSNVNSSIIIAISTVLLISFLVFIIIRDITGSVSNLNNAALRMAKGDAQTMASVRSKDELGQLARSFNKMIITTRDFSEAALRIGQGDYSEGIPIRGQEDTLGLALTKMKDNLQLLSKDNLERTWLLTGNRELNDKIRGEKDLNLLAQDVIVCLSQYIKAQIGAIYLKENDRFNLVGSYAFDFRKGNQSSFIAGQGLVGQAAIEKKAILFSEVPPDYVRIQSGIVNSVPVQILVFPFLYENEVKGIIELGTAHAFSRLDMDLLNMVSENIAIAFHTSQSRSKLQELLEETQRQAEELETQQEELRQSNEELHEKTELLERSESELKTQQEELQQTNEELEEKANLLEEQMEKLEVAKMDLETKARELELTSKYKSEFLANMSHELRTPLNSILILSQLLAENKNKVLGDKEIKFSKNIYNSGADLLNLINEILDLSKVESGRMELEISEVPISDLENDLMAMFSEVARNKSIDFSIAHEANNISVFKTDKQRLEQILKNLLSNAFKFTGEGGNVVLGIRLASPECTYKSEKLKSAPEVIAFSVQDTGIGIPRKKLSIVFEAFQQADGSTKRKYGGTGLGLSISRELANALGGEIQAESVEGEGSVFTLYLPLHFDKPASGLVEKNSKVNSIAEEKNISDAKIDQAVQADGEPYDDRHIIQAHDKVVLIMEDDTSFARILLDFVRDRHYKGVVAVQGNTGLSYARHYKPDAILLDMGLPVMDGSEVLKHLKNDPQLRHVPVQIISGYDKRKEGLELGAFDFIRKPVVKEDLQRAFDKIEDFVSKKLKKLLVVEDNTNQNHAIRELIGDGDVKSYSAYSGEEAFDMMHSEKFDCIIIDLGLPDMSGFDLLEKIKADEMLRKVPIIVYTGRDLTREEHAVLSRLANTVVLKTANSQERLLDETMLFLHRVESRLPKEKQNIIRKLHRTEDVLKDRKILIVDDDIRNIYSLTNALEEEGIHSLTAENGRVAIKVLKENPDIEMILMDIMMPEMDGYEATRIIRKLDRFNKLPIIALTARAMKGDREKCLQAGMSDYIAKPVNVEQLLSLMRVWLYQ